MAVEISESSLHITDVVVDTPATVDFIGQCQEPEVAVRRALDMGATVLTMTESSLDRERVEQAFERLHQRFESSVEAAFASATATIASGMVLFSEGPLSQTLDKHRKLLDEELAAVFSPGSARSVQRHIDAMLVEHGQAMQHRFKELLTAEDAFSPLGIMREQLRSVQAGVNALSQQLAVSTATARERALQASHGVEFERDVFAMMMPWTMALGDVLEMVGTRSGLLNDRGDLLITINPTLSPTPMRIVLELRDRPSRVSRYSPSNIRNDLTVAQENRQATAGIFVASQADALPSDSFGFLELGRGQFAVAISEEGEPHALLLAFRLARFEMLVRQASSGRQGNDQVIRDAVNRTRLALERFQSARACLTKVAHQLSATNQILTHLEREVIDALDSIESELRPSRQLMAVGGTPVEA